MPDGSGPTAAAATSRPQANQSKAPISGKPSSSNTRESNTQFKAAQKHFMHTSWPEKPQSEWTFPQRFFASMNVLPNFLEDEPAPIKKLGDPVPVWRKRDQALSIAPWLITPLAFHYGYMQLSGNTLHPVAAYFLYMTFYQGYSIWTTRRTTLLGQVYGHFDGEKPRDGVPDDLSWHIFAEVLKVLLVRPLLGVMIAYKRDELPSVSVFLPFKLLAWSCVLDFWFYWYHRAMHQVPFLWKFHRTHHMTKHPSSLLSAFADYEQEICDAFIIPLLTYAVLHPWFNFSEWFIATMCVVQAEAAGHSGARVYVTSVMSGWALRPFKMELSLEDHDLHHRNGYRHLSGNYGKQTLLWDVLFGTRQPRQESADEYVDWNYHVKSPWLVGMKKGVSLFPKSKEEAAKAEKTQ